MQTQTYQSLKIKGTKQQVINDVLVVEKQKFPRFVIGESLLPRCMEHLQELELISEIEKAGFQKKKGVVFTWKERTFMVCQPKPLLLLFKTLIRLRMIFQALAFRSLQQAA